MLVPMTQLEIVGRRARMDDVLAALQQVQLAEVARAEPPGSGPPPEEDQDEDPEHDDHLETLLDDLAEVEAQALALLDPVPGDRSGGALPRPDPLRVQAILAEARAAARDLPARRAALAEEATSLPPLEAGLSALLPLVPELASLTDAELAQVHLATLVLMLDDPDGAVVDELRDQLAGLLGDRAMLVASPAGPSRGCLLVVAADDVGAVESLLGRDHVNRMTLPDRYSGRSLRSTVEAMRSRLAVLPRLVAEVEAGLRTALAPHAENLHAAVVSVRARRERLLAGRQARVTERGFALRVWVPIDGVEQVRRVIATAEPAAVVATVPPRTRTGNPPVLIRNSRVLRPFERLVGFLSWPAPGGLDPTGLMAAVLPALFGIMVGDIGYGVLLVCVGGYVRRRWGGAVPAVGDLGRILVLGGAWSVVFGAFFGELFGDLGKSAFGMPALWFYRGGPEALTPLLTFVVAVGAAHLVLGLLIGLWLAIRERHLPHLLERGGTLLVLGGLFALAGTAVSALPGSALPPALAVVVVGIVLAGIAHGPLGVLLGPLEVVGRIGNVLSYLRLAAVGLASVYLAIVANELARQAPLLVGIVVAAFFHALNLALAAFSPMIQALRLHYVEFFGTFHGGGGREFRPLGAGLPRLPLEVPARATPAPETIGAGR